MSLHLSKNAADIIKQRIKITPKILIVCGSGLHTLAENIENPVEIPYHDLPGFPECSVAGHHGILSVGMLEGQPVACLQGRVHFYEGNSEAKMRHFIHTMRLAGCEIMLATNSSGSLRDDVRPGNLMTVTDHINFQFRNPLVGQNENEIGPRFISMEDAYDPELRKQFHAAAKALSLTLTDGVYIGVLGPTFETPAEIRAFKILGADLVGMSTVADVIVARHAGMRVGVLSVITNMASGMNPTHLSHEETLSGAKEGVTKLAKLIRQFLKGFTSMSARYEG